MRLRLWLLPVSLAVSVPVLAQPPAGPGTGPWAADADGDGRITRDEMTAYMDRRFGLMDQDSDGLVPVQAMQRMLGHERQGREQGEGDRKPGGSDRKRGVPGGRSGTGGTGGGGGDPPPGGPPPANRRAGSEAMPPPPPGHAMPYPEDGNDDGQIDRAEFLSPALAMFADQDRNGDGVLTADELPPPPRRGPAPDGSED